MPGKTQPDKIYIPAPNLKLMQVTIKGTAPLIYHKWSEKAIRMILDKQLKTVAATSKKEAKNPAQDAVDTFYVDSDGFIAFPVLCIKNAMVGAARSMRNITMTILRQGIWVVGDPEFTRVLSSNKEIKLEDIKQSIFKEQDEDKVTDNKDRTYWRQDMVRVGMGAADIRFRGEIKNWSMKPWIKWNDDLFSQEQILNLLNTAGFSCGLGEWRIEKSGINGTFEVVSNQVENK